MSVFGCKALGRGTDAGADVPLSGAGRVSGQGSPHEPSEAGRVGRGGARERVQFSSSGGNETKRTLRRRRARGAAPWTERSDARTAGCSVWQSAVPPRRAHEYMAVRLCIEMRPLVPKGISISSLSEIPY